MPNEVCSGSPAHEQSCNTNGPVALSTSSNAAKPMLALQTAAAASPVPTQAARSEHRIGWNRVLSDLPTPPPHYADLRDLTDNRRPYGASGWPE
eukprot:scaffold25203_cov118-Isochrysis_galbana.AAC.1